MHLFRIYETIDNKTYEHFILCDVNSSILACEINITLEHNSHLSIKEICDVLNIKLQPYTFNYYTIPTSLIINKEKPAYGVLRCIHQ